MCVLSFPLLLLILGCTGIVLLCAYVYRRVIWLTPKRRSMKISAYTLKRATEASQRRSTPSSWVHTAPSIEEGIKRRDGRNVERPQED